MAVSVELHNTGDPAVGREVQALVEHALSDRAGDWRVSIMGSRTEGVPSIVEGEGGVSTRLMVESGWKLSKGKENRLEAKLSHDYQDRTSKRRETDGVSQPQRTGIAAHGGSDRAVASGRLALQEIVRQSAAKSLRQATSSILAPCGSPSDCQRPLPGQVRFD